jgi:Fe-S cluster assembly protein SufB
VSTTQIDEVLRRGYDAGFVTEIEQEQAPPGLTEDTVQFISAKKNEPDWLLDWRLQAFRMWQRMREPRWANVSYPPIDYQATSYFAAPKSDAGKPKSLDEVDPKLLETYEKLGIPLHEREILAGVAVDAVFDSEAVVTWFREEVAEVGVRGWAFSDAVEALPEVGRE